MIVEKFSEIVRILIHFRIKWYDVKLKFIAILIQIVDSCECVKYVNT